MKIILQAIKSLLNNIQKLAESANAAANSKLERVNPRPEGSIAMGENVFATGKNSIAIGFGVDATVFKHSASGEGSAAFGRACTASNEGAFACNSFTRARGLHSFASGDGTTASGPCAHSEGMGTTASGYYAHAEGNECIASAIATHAAGQGTIAAKPYQYVHGRYNLEDTSANDGLYAHIVGNGEHDGARSNAHTLDWDGNAWFAGTVEGTALILSSPSGKRF